MAGKGFSMLGWKKWTGRISAVTAVTAATTLVWGGVAFADNVQDNIVDTGTGVSLVAGSSTGGTASIRVVGNSSAGDDDPGCNIDAGENPLVLDIVTPVGVTADPDPLSITSCGTDFIVTFKASNSAVSGRATVTIVSGPAGGGTYQNQVDIPITVTHPNTAPVVSVTGVVDNTTYRKSSVPQPGCSVVDAEDIGESATPQITNGAYDALGSHTVSCSYTDGGGITRSASATYTVIRDADTTKPVISYTLNPAAPDGDNNWYTGTVSLDWTVIEGESNETLQITGCVDRTISADQAATTYSCSATSEGGIASDSVTIKRDGTAPEVAYDGVVSGTAGANGWYRSPVTVNFTATDALSGPATASQTAITSGDGAAVTVDSPVFTDNAGNSTVTGAVSSPAFKIDSQLPNAPIASLDPAPNGDDWNNSNVVIHFAPAGDNGPSGVDHCTADVTVDTEGANQTVSGTCTDEAGNQSLATQVSVNLDKTNPTISSSVTVSGTAGANGWYTSDVEVTFSATDTLSGLVTDTKKVTSSGEGSAVEVASPAFTDRADNTTASGNVTKTYKIDKSAPNAPTASLEPAPNGDDWNNSNVVVHFEPAGDSGPSGVDHCTADVTVDTEGANQTVSGTCTDAAGNQSLATQVSVNLDKTNPTISSSVTVSGTAGANGWYTSDVEVTFSATDTLSGLVTDTKKVTSSGEGSAVEVASPAFTDRADNTTASGAVTKTYKIDKTAPATVTFVGGPGSSYYFGNDPAAPTCTATDATSGLASCVVTGGGTSVGPHSYTATATDNAGNTSTATLNYIVLGWTARGYYAPVDMNGVWNSVKGGSTVPLKFEVFAGATEHTSTTVVRSFVAKAVACPGSSAPVDEIETVLTGGTSLRYDLTGGQFIQNWQTPKKPSTCAQAITTTQDGSVITANFMFK